MSQNESNKHIIFGQKYAYATVSLVLGICCFVNFVGMEKAILAIVFAWMALRTPPEPVLKERRTWAKAGLSLGALMLIIVPTLIFLNFDRLREFIEVLTKMSNGR
jgi:hypothetical protein